MTGDSIMDKELQSLKVSIFGRDYNIKVSADEEYIKEIAAHVDSVMRNISNKTKALYSDHVAVLAALNITDELYKERARFREFVEEITRKLEKAMLDT